VYELTGDENYCEKYPSDATYCSDDSLPMMFKVPSFSYYSGESILGLGDVILPGLLIVWAARHDLRKYGSLYSWECAGFYLAVVLAYCVGLFLADAAVTIFQVRANRLGTACKT
jgi:signal peptide peptidase-like protein 2B